MALLSSLSFKSLVARLPRGRYRRGMVVLAGSNAVAQTLMLAASPILTRLYTPAEFGLLAVYISITAILGVVLAWRYERAIPLPETEEEAMAITVLGISIVLFNTVLGLIVVLLFRDSIASLLNTPALGDLLWLLPLSMLLTGGFQVARSWCVRRARFGAIGRARITQVLSSLAIQIGGAALGPVALIAGQVANQGAGSWSLGRHCWRDPSVSSVRPANLLVAMKRYREFPLFSSWSALLNRFSASLPTLLFAIFFGPVSAGLYALASRVLSTPSTVIGTAISSVFMSSAAERYRHGTLDRLARRTFAALISVSLPLCLVIAVVSPRVFAVVFGSEWEIAGEYARWLSIIVICVVVGSPFGVLFAVLERQRHELVFQTLLFVLRAGGIGLGAYNNDALLAIACFSVLSGIAYAGMIVWVCRQLDIGLLSMLKPGLPALAASLVIAMPGLIALYVSDTWLWLVLNALCAAMLAAYTIRTVRHTK